MLDTRLSILVIDDNPADVQYLRRLLRETDGMELLVHHEADGDGGRERLAAGGIDCLILDYRLGATTGLEVLRAIRDSGDDVPVIAMTGKGSEHIAVESMKLGAQDYLVKHEVTRQSLLKAIENAMEKVVLRRKLREQREELESFVGTVAHDLRAPLRRIARCSGFLREDLPDLDENCERHLGHIESTVTRASHLVDNLLEYARAGRSNDGFEPVDLDEVASSVRSNLSALLEASRAVLEWDPLPTVTGDSVALTQLFQNLVANAVSYNRADTPKVRIAAVEGPDSWKISVADNGIGIAPDQIDRVFEPLVRGRDTPGVGGSGLGLAICAKIVKQHGGAIRVESEPDRGSLFEVTLVKDPS